MTIKTKQNNDYYNKVSIESRLIALTADRSE